MSLSHSAYTMLYSLCKQPILGHTRDIKVNNISAIERADMCVLPGGSQVERALILSVDTETAFLTDFTGEVDNFVRSKLLALNAQSKFFSTYLIMPYERTYRSIFLSASV
jgi:hypothetical protein